MIIDNLIYDGKNRFGLIWSCILKDVNFIIFRIFLDFFVMNLFGFIMN